MTVNIRHKIKNLSGGQWLGILGLLALFVALRWNNVDAPLTRDEGEYAYSAQLMIQGIAPYQHAFIQKPPGVFYSYALCNLLLPQVFWSPRLLAGMFMVLATVVLGIISRLEFGKEAGLPVMWLMTPMVLLPGLDEAAASVEAFMLLPLLGTVAVYCYSRQNGHQDKHWFAAGCLAAATFLYKYTAFPILAFMFFVWFIERWKHTGKINSIFRAAAWLFAGGAIIGIVGLAFFLVTDGGKTFWECTVAFNRYYAQSNLFSWANFWSWLHDFWRNWWILFLLPWAVLLRPQRRILFWVGMFACSLVATNGGCYGQYYMAMMPFWALLGAAGICALASCASQWSPGLAPAATGCLMTAVVVFLLVFPDASWIFRSPGQFVEEKMGESPFIEAPLAAQEVDQMSAPGDYVYVAGSEPEILYYARRYSSTRFVTTYPLMDPNPLAPGYQREAIQDLLQDPPKLIVFVQLGNSWTRQSTSPPDFINFMGKFLTQSYDLEGGFVKRDPQKGYWTTHLSVPEYQKASLLLYKRKPGNGPTEGGTNYSR